MVTNVHLLCEFLVELLTRLWLEVEVRQQEGQKSLGNTGGFSPILFSVSAVS